MLDMLEGNLPEGEARRVRRHLEDCPECRSEAECLEGGLNGVQEAVPLQVGSGPHLTPCRREATLRAARKARKKTRLFTVRKFAAAAAAAMLLVSAWFLAQDLLQPEQQPQSSRDRATAQKRMLPGARPPAPRRKDGDPSGIVRVASNEQPRDRQWDAAPAAQPFESGELMYNQAGNLTIPVENVRYHPRRERYWW